MNTDLSASRSHPGRWRRTAWTVAEHLPATTIDALACAGGFEAMRGAFRPTGGMARGADLARLWADYQLGDVANLAELLRAGEVFGFDWNDDFWVPMFQFDLWDLSIRPGPRQVCADLGTELDDWNLAAWFARPNGSLSERRPVDLLGTDLLAVLDAARADRFVATG